MIKPPLIDVHAAPALTIPHRDLPASWLRESTRTHPAAAAAKAQRDQLGARRARSGRNTYVASTRNSPPSTIMKIALPPEAIGSSFTYMVIAIAATARPTSPNQPTTVYSALCAHGRGERARHRW